MCSGSKSIWRRSYIAAANGWTSWPGISLGSRIAAESFSGADAVPGFYGKPDAVYRLRRRSRIIALHIVRTSKHPLSACVCGCLRTFEPLWADVCGCLRTRPKCLGMTLPLCLRVSATKENGCLACGHMSADVCGRRNYKEFLLLTDIHSKMETPTGPQTNPACIKTDAHRTNAFATWRSRWSLAFALTMQHHHEEKKLPPHLTNPKKNLQMYTKKETT